MKPTDNHAAPVNVAPVDFIPARMLNEFVYCPRLFFLEHVMGVFVHNADTLHGKAVHSRVDRGTGELPASKRKKSEPTTDTPQEVEEILHARSVSLGSDRLGTVAKLDLVEAATDGADGCVGLVQPVEYKSGSPQEGDKGPGIWDADRMQLGLQILLLRDNGYTCTGGFLYYRATRQRVPLEWSPELEAWILDRIAAARRCAQGKLPPPLVDSPKCPRCSLVPVCLPDETRLLREGPTLPDGDGQLAVQELFPFDAEFPPERPPPPWSRGELGPREHLRPRRLLAPRNETKPLYVSSPGMSLGRKSETVVVKEQGVVVQEVRLIDLDHIAIFGSAVVSTPLVQALCEADIPITYFTMGGWFYGLTRGHALKNVFVRIEQFAAAAHPSRSLALARTFIHGKIRNQRTFLMRNHVAPPELTLARLRGLAQAALRADTHAELLGIEGTAAALYYADFAGMIKLGNPDDFLEGDEQDVAFFRFSFTHRNRRPPRDAVNALLSLAYSLLARDCTIAAHATGMDPYVGFLHQPRFGRPALALDLMEEFRPLVADSVVITCINNRLVTPRDFVAAGDSVNLSNDGRKRFLEAYERRMAATIVHPVFDYTVSYRRALELQSRLLAKALEGDVPDYTPFVTR